MTDEIPSIHIVGAGVSGLYCADRLLKEGFQVHLYDHASGPGKKFLIAGHGGLNLTHSEELESFCQRYRQKESFFKRALEVFSPQDLRHWCEQLGVETFVGTSGRVFPKKLKAAEILLTLRKRLESYSNFHFHLKHKLVGIDKEKNLTFEGPQGEKEVSAQMVILALGGGSWKKTGSDGQWVPLIEGLGIKVNPLLPMNCGFLSSWSTFFKEKVERLPLKNIELCFGPHKFKTEIMVTPYGLEGTGVYALSGLLRDEILQKGEAKLFLDLKPDVSESVIEEKLKAKKEKDSLSNFFRKAFSIDRDELAFLREFTSKEEINNLNVLSSKIKSIEVTLSGYRSIDEAISTSGGVCFEELTTCLESKKVPGLFFAGEMLDFEAPTGGYLIQGAFSTAALICQQISNDKKATH